MADSYKLLQPKIVASAADKNIVSKIAFQDPVNLPGVILRFGQDATSSVNRAAPDSQMSEKLPMS